jgi:hypothetical protein
LYVFCNAKRNDRLIKPSCAVGATYTLAVFALALATFRANAPLHVPAVADVHVGQFAVFGAASAKGIELVGDAFLRRGHGARLLLFVLVAVRVRIAVLAGRRGLRGSDELLLLGVVRPLVVLVVVVLVVDPLGSAELDGRRRGLGDERLGLLGLPTAAARGHDRRWVLGRRLGFVAGRRRRGAGSSSSSTNRLALALARGDVHSSASTALTLTAAPGRHPSIVLTSASVCCFLRAVTASLMLLNRRPPGE